MSEPSREDANSEALQQTESINDNLPESAPTMDRPNSSSDNVYVSVESPNRTDMADTVEPMMPCTENTYWEGPADQAPMYDVAQTASQIPSSNSQPASHQPRTIFIVSTCVRPVVQGQHGGTSDTLHPFYGHYRPQAGTPRFPTQPRIGTTSPNWGTRGQEIDIPAGNPTIQSISDSLRTGVPAPSLDARSIDARRSRARHVFIRSRPRREQAELPSRVRTLESSFGQQLYLRPSRNGGRQADSPPSYVTANIRQSLYVRVPFRTVSLISSLVLELLDHLLDRGTIARRLQMKQPDSRWMTLEQCLGKISGSVSMKLIVNFNKSMNKHLIGKLHILKDNDRM
ncbi:hypothetical protein BZA77DRAFT_349570 [Pyronema omphalodes]|nr:hypothetical protein BZA77DRAFT_349570 [Pyronema omphalodes]